MLEPAGATGDDHIQHDATEARGGAGGLRRSAILALVVEIEVALRGTDRPNAELRKIDACSGGLGLGEIDGDMLGELARSLIGVAGFRPTDLVGADFLRRAKTVFGCRRTRDDGNDTGRFRCSAWEKNVMRSFGSNINRSAWVRGTKKLAGGEE
jgi:hypothetical protein